MVNALQIALVVYSLATGGPPAMITQIIALSTAESTNVTPVVTPATPPAAAQAPVAPTPTTKLTGVAAWAALVGNTVAGKNEDDDDVFEYYSNNGRVKQKVGDEDVSAGKWTLKGNKLCFFYPDDDADTCYGIEVDGTTATFTDEDGGKTVYQILPGNPKDM